MRRFTRLAIGLAICFSALLVFLAGEHIPFVAVFAPRTFCFGEIGAIHVVAFVLPLAPILILLRHGRVAQAG